MRRPLLLLAMFVLACTPAAQAAEVGVVSDLNWGISPAEQQRTVDDLEEIGARWVRLHVGWKDFEPVPGALNRWNVEATRTAIAQAREAGARVILMVYDAPAWASGSPRANVPREPGDLASFLRRLAGEYRGTVAAYEIWNEPNYARFWSTGPDARAYTDLLRAAYPAVKGADAAALVLFGGLSTNDWEYLEDAYRAGVRGSFDALATHPYADCGGTPDRVVRGRDGRMTRGTFVAYRELRRTMQAHADAKPIYVTEFGWSTASTACDPGAGAWVGGVSEETQAAYLRRAYELFAEDDYVVAALVYNYRNNFFSRDADEIEARYGVVRTNFSRKPAFAVLQAAARAAGTGAGAGAGEGNGAAPRDDASPTSASVRLSAPASFRSTLVATADAPGMSSVAFYVGGRRVAVDRRAPFRLAWRVPALLPAGVHRIAAVASDAGGRTVTRSLAVRRVR